MGNILESILNIGSPWNMIVLVVLIGSIGGIIGSISKQVRKFACHRTEAHLKRDLVERGLSVDEIERIIAAKSPSEKQSEDS